MRAIVAVFAALTVSLLPAAAPAQDTEPFAVYDREVLGKAQPDECWYRNAKNGRRSGKPEPPFPLNGPELLEEGCPDRQDRTYSTPGTAGGVWLLSYDTTVTPPAPVMLDGRPKANQAYVWGLTRAGNDLWFGTMANTNCLVSGEYLGNTRPTDNDAYVCEMARSRFTLDPWNVPQTMGDWRAPRVLRYDTVAGGAPVDVTPADGGGRLLTETTIGFRSAGTLGDIVLLAGPALPSLPTPQTYPLAAPPPPTPPIPGLNVFAFDAATHAFIGWQNLPEYVNVRRWVSAGGVLYTSVQNAAGGGSVLRWRGYAKPDPVGDPQRIACDLEVVGTVDGDAADLVEHNGRLYVGTWPVMDFANPRPAGIWMSPPLPAGGLTGADAGRWSKVWSWADYEPDPVVVYTYGAGALASFSGQLYFSTMHVPGVAADVFARIFDQMYPGQLPDCGWNNPDPDCEDYGDEISAATTRAISVFRTKGFDTGWPQVELLYGDYQMPAWNGDSPPTWRMAYNRLMRPARYGAAGFGNPNNNYLWSFAVHDGQLFAGTMDEAIFSYGADEPQPNPLGADLYRFLPADLPAVPESLDGIGNWANYGVRNMLAAPEGLYLGSANPMNISPDGGWELMRLTRRRGVFPPSGAGGALFTVSGAGYGAKRGKVFVGPKAATVLFWSKNQLYCRLPALGPGVKTVKVVTAAGKVFKYAGAFTVPPPPPTP